MIAAAETLVWQASAVEHANWLPAEKLQDAKTTVQFDEESAKVVARKQVLYEDLLLQETPAAHPDEEQVTKVLVDAALAHWDQIVPALDSPAGQFLTRLRRCSARVDAGIKSARR